MPRPKKEPGLEPKKRSRTGCWPCKARKVKCGEEKPACTNCLKSGETCDYSIRLNWGGRGRKGDEDALDDMNTITFVSNPASINAKTTEHSHEHIFSAQHIAPAPAPARPSSSQRASLPTPEPTPSSDGATIDPLLRGAQYPPGQDRATSQYTSFPFQPHPNGAWQHSPPTSAPAPMKEESRWSPENPAKRMKMSSPPNSHHTPVFAVPQYPNQVEQSPSASHLTTHSISSIVNTPATPGSTISSGSPFPQYQAPITVQDPPDLRRLSVKSLLSDPSDDADRPQYPRVNSHGGWRTYGYDHGFPDLDLPNNDDTNVIQPRSPDLRRASVAAIEDDSSSNDSDPKLIAFEPGGYYAQPVPIKLPRSLEPLPPELTHNQMNLLYFHHFINHTARILVPHDCPENPLRGVLPIMAVRNPHLLHLVLAYSASHRARLLLHPEPRTRIAGWIADVVPALRQAVAEPSSPGIAEPTDPSSLAPLATAIMFASLNIISPDIFDIAIPWQRHLHTAREMIIAKGGLDHLAQKADGARDKAIFFLSRWFAYLDVLGSLSGGQQEEPLYGAYLEDGGGCWLVNRDPTEEIYQIDCFFGFSGRCISLLAQVAELAAQCDKERIDPMNKEVRPDWTPSQQVREEADALRTRILESATGKYHGCSHANRDSSEAEETAGGKYDLEEIYATNELFHWAALIQLARRVLGLPASDPEVQENVKRSVNSLIKVRRGSSAESNLLFPMFSAGCEALTVEEREVFSSRLAEVEGWGLDHVGRARRLMELVWETGRGWETIVDGEFLG
ncbi:fungal-specific transcription factor domain-containing protein [Neohortaea acidophila]|uniref:Fungal-specific transcription factor domain-containing protein n=1 Tax=Neohortaea acidophila TaxID=245834 RepID=A0A6A6PLW9_9PEZI|nr:fungal-specific transcription factor domain-containing protein [Neohortaea acidophila]KAF2480816.1 fungal-specific transcription factor domain-containing protein [Neohortaea acidophila]